MRALLLALFVAGTTGGPPPAPLRIVTSLTTYASIAREIAGDRATVTAIAEGDEDPHFVQPRPSFVPLMRDADLFITTGMDLELWVPTLLDRAGNPRIREGGPGYVAAYKGINVLEVPASLSRAGGDIHVDGNPHIHTDFINAIIIARNILEGLGRVSPADAAFFAAREKDFEVRVLNAAYGAEVVRLVTPATIFDLARAGREVDFLQKTTYQGKPLAARLGGWMQQALVFRDRDMVCYHREWAYFSFRYNVRCIDYIEVKPGIPATPRHKQDVIELMRTKKIPVLFASNYFDRGQIQAVATATGATAVVVPENTNGAPGVASYFDLMSAWVDGLAKGFAGGGAR